MKFVASAVLLTARLVQNFQAVEANAGVFTYYDDPFQAPGSSEVIRVGPSTWRDLLIPGNQCGGQIGQRTGYGQSPVVIPRQAADTCDTNLDGYEFEGATCTYADLNFRIVTNGVIVGPHFGNPCSMGRMRIPGGGWYQVLQFHIHTNSEHSVAGKYYPAELHVVHRRDDGKDFAVFGTFIDEKEPSGNTTGPWSNEDDGHHGVFEWFLKGWEARSRQTDELCAAKSEGTGVFTPNRLFTSRQQLLTCPAVAEGVIEDDVANLEWYDEVTTNPQTLVSQTHHVPVIKSPDFPEGAIPEIYSALPTNPTHGIYTYRGGLTTPPCTEIVRWNLLDRPMLISPRQLDRLYRLILCFVERSTCRHATVASSFGGTNRPPQNLWGRKVTHRCRDVPPTAVAMEQEQAQAQTAQVLQDPLPPPVPKPWRPPAWRQPWWGILFPWFTIAMGIVVYFVLSRLAPSVPYTACLFVLGTFMGIGLTGLQKTDQLSTSIRMWANINSEMLLLAFLPGLLFKDAFGLDVYLLKDALGQCLVMAFPMVLAGTVLMACVGYYVLPYGWSFNLSMTFGAILSATDPVAVSALLNEVGAPPRLRMHIAGESLMNDGSAMVFYFLFSQMFLYELNIPGLGRDVDVAQGFAIFFRMSLGAVAIGLAFGLGLISALRYLDRRFNGEEGTIQVASTICFAYLTYYVAESVCRTSGVLAVVTCGVMAKAFGEPLINDKAMMDKFWNLTELLLNSVLFVLGGVVWGTVISNLDPRRIEDFTGMDWGYLFLVYVLAMAVRFFLFGSFYPIISRIGLRTNPKEAFFASFSGLRGAVGIALAIALDNELRRDTVPGNPNRAFTSQLFGLTGGIALFTLLINGMLCGPLLKKLGLARSTETRAKVVARYHEGLKDHLLDKLLKYLSHPWYCDADTRIVLQHVPALTDTTHDDLKLALKRLKADTPTTEYKKPNLEAFRPSFSPSEFATLDAIASITASDRIRAFAKEAAARKSREEDSQHETGFSENEAEQDEETLIELRQNYIELLRHAYKRLQEKGEVNVRDGLVVFTLEKSLEYALDGIANGKKLCDWEELQKLVNPRIVQKLAEYVEKPAGHYFRKLFPSKSEGNAHQIRRVSALATRGSLLTQLTFKDLENLNSGASKVSKVNSKEVERTITFIEAHLKAQRMFKRDFCGGQFLTRVEQTVLDESQEEVEAAEKMLRSKDPAMLRGIVSHLLCTVLLNAAALYIESLVCQGLLKEQEGEEYMHTEGIECKLEEVNHYMVHTNKEGCTKHHAELDASRDDKIVDSVQTEEEEC